jgi:hypothetical protein
MGVERMRNASGMIFKKAARAGSAKQCKCAILPCLRAITEIYLRYLPMGACPFSKKNNCTNRDLIARVGSHHTPLKILSGHE